MVTLPKAAQSDAKELAKIARFLTHYTNGTLRSVASELAPGVLMLDPLYASPHSPVCALSSRRLWPIACQPEPRPPGLAHPRPNSPGAPPSQPVLSGLEEIDHQRRFDSTMPSDMSIDIVSAVTEQQSGDGSEVHVYISFKVTNPWSAVWESFLATLLALPQRSDDVGLLRFTLTSPRGLISEVACLKKPTKQLHSMQNRHVDSYNLQHLGDSGTKHPALVLLERM
jgi:hypothetical protein